MGDSIPDFIQLAF
jgi:hypothetical protein